MLNPPELAAAEEPGTDSYGDVALGVECAWPESIPVIEAFSEAAISID